MRTKLILGTAQIGMDYGINNKRGKISKSEAFEIFEYAFDNGIEYLDTAPVYGDAQQIIGEYHHLYPTKKFKIITKIPSGYSFEKIENLIDEFLLEMNVSSIDVIHFHSINDYLNTEKNLLNGIISSLKKNNKVKSFGVSIYENSDAELLLLDTNINIIQLPFNLLDNLNCRGSLLKDSNLSGKKIHSRSAFLQGLFLMESSKVPFDDLKPYIEEAKAISTRFDVPIDELALQYCLNQNLIENVLIGVDSLAQTIKNISIARKQLPIECLEAVNNIIVQDIANLNPNRWVKE
jgi:aryl-alcohol dehydrogenase-like predicted oxidoreductase